MPSCQVERSTLGTLLLFDSKSALTVAEPCGSWCTRYFAVRAARLGEEHRRATVTLRHCKADSMAAGALAKMCSSTLLDQMRSASAGDLPATPDSGETLSTGDDSWWACRVFR